jgi:hypothetical protein
MKRTFSLLGAVLLTMAPGVVSAQETTFTQVLSAPETSQTPYRWAGFVVILSSSNLIAGTASGVVVQPNVYATAAHVIFDDGRGEWEEARRHRFSAGHHSSNYGSRTGSSPLGFVRWASYRTRSNAEDGPEGTSSPDTFNLDFAVGYRLSKWMTDASYAPSWVDDEVGVNILREKREISIVGYPADPSAIMSSNIGRMHATEWREYSDVYWDAVELEPDTHGDSEGIRFGTYTIYDGITYGGNSGGPVYVRDDDGTAVMAALLVSGDDTNVSGVRALTDGAWDLVIEAAQASAAEYALRQPENLVATPAAGRITLSWSDSGAQTDHYRIERRHADGYDLVGRAEALATPTFTDESVEAGRSYLYRVTAVDAVGNRSPASSPLEARARGVARDLGRLVGAPGLGFVTGGEVGVTADQGGGIRTGLMQSMERSYVELSLIGPGTLTFEWAVSSEENPDYNDPSSDYYRDIYDAIFFYQNDVQTAFLTGEVAGETKTVNVVGGSHTFRWEYSKDPYSNEGEDAGFLRSVSWKPLGSTLWFYGAQDAGGGYRLAPWFGYYTTGRFPWTFSSEHGWLYLSRTGSGSPNLWAFDPNPEIGWMLLIPEFYPNVCTAKYGWAYYYEGTGVGGPGRYFYLSAENRFLHLPLQ